MIGVKHIVSIARNSGQLAINPFAGYLISPETKDRGFLDKEEINLLVNAKMKNAQYELVRDLFVFTAKVLLPVSRPALVSQRLGGMVILQLN